ncbi:conserved hypothetical protein [Ricinus communis]|uniref:Uncharacterized protein n=1 Tax=Ricinus communis TaxID=3988 RepID=B9SBC3_RICCO|nr:conserved hypothetical protein [Ricinus communis]
MKIDEQALEPGTDEIRGKHGTGQYTGGARHDRDLTAVKLESNKQRIELCESRFGVKPADSMRKAVQRRLEDLLRKAASVEEGGKTKANKVLPGSIIAYNHSFLVSSKAI